MLLLTRWSRTEATVGSEPWWNIGPWWDPELELAMEALWRIRFPDREVRHGTAIVVSTSARPDLVIEDDDDGDPSGPAK